MDALDNLKIDFSKAKLLLTTGEQVYIETEDKVYKLSFDYNQFQELNDEFRNSNGEKTINELEDKILSLEQKIEDLEEKVEQYENY